MFLNCSGLQKKSGISTDGEVKNSVAAPGDKGICQLLRVGKGYK